MSTSIRYQPLRPHVQKTERIEPTGFTKSSQPCRDYLHKNITCFLHVSTTKHVEYLGKKSVDILIFKGHDSAEPVVCTQATKTRTKNWNPQKLLDKKTCTTQLVIHCFSLRVSKVTWPTFVADTTGFALGTEALEASAGRWGALGVSAAQVGWAPGVQVQVRLLG